MPTTYAIPNGRTVMDATTYTANGGAQTITNQYGFKPDLVWSKCRSTTSNNWLANSIIGPSYYLRSNLTNAEVNDPTYYTSFNSNGYSVGSGNMGNGETMVGWQWQAGQGSNTTNTTGTITSTVSVNATAGFSIVSYTTQSSGTGTVGHGLGVAPSMIILKNTALNNNWIVYHASVGASAYLYLNTTAATQSDSSVFNGTTPTSTVFSMGTGEAGSLPTIVYCWAQVAGFSQFGSYTGNGSADGPFVYTGFRPKFVLIKQSSNPGEWIIWDTTRSPSNFVGAFLLAESSAAEGASAEYLDLLSNGFKIRTTNATLNTNGNTSIYMAFAENPFKYANAR
jgi:hypothetical protein